MRCADTGCPPRKLPRHPRARRCLTIQTDQAGWPTRAAWPGMADSLFDGQVGEVVHVALEGFAARWEASTIRRDPAIDASKR
jgi:hypothetical protein